MMKPPIIVIGIGEIGSVFARGFLRLGHPVYPATRGEDLQTLANDVASPELVLIAVGEKELPSVLKDIPEVWKDRVALLQNELLPKNYAHLPEATVISVWFEKKKGQDSKVIIPSPTFGDKAQQLVNALSAIDISARIVDSKDELLFELVLKNLYILTSNIAGLKVGGNVGELWQNHETFAREVANDVISLQEAMTEQSFDSEALIQAMVSAFMGDTQHMCMGRSAPARLQRAIENADQYQLTVNCLRDIQREYNKG